MKHRIENGPLENTWKLYDVRYNHYFMYIEWIQGELHISIHYSNDKDARIPEWVSLNVKAMPLPGGTTHIIQTCPKAELNGNTDWIFNYKKNTTLNYRIRFGGDVGRVAIRLSCLLRSNWYKFGKTERNLLHSWDTIYVDLPFMRL